MGVISGQAAGNKPVPILVDGSGRQYILISDTSGNTQPAGDVSTRPIYTVPGFRAAEHIHVHKDGIGEDLALMLIDLSDTTNWPHTETGSIHIHRISISIAASKVTDARVDLGFLSDVDALNGDMHVMFSWEIGNVGTNEPRDIDHTLDFQLFPYCVDKSHWWGPTKSDNALFQTDTNLAGPDGNIAYPSGDGDLVLYIEWTAGVVNVAISIDYHTEA